MTYLNNLIHHLTLYTLNYPAYVLLVLFTFFELLIIQKLLFYKKNYKDLKINNKVSNLFFISVYFIVFIGIILLIRYFRWGYNFNLILFCTNIIVFYNKIPLIVFIPLLFILIIAFLMLIHIKRFFNRELLKSFIYYYYNSRRNGLKKFIEKNPNKDPTSIMTPYDYHFFVFLYHKLTAWTYKRFIARLIMFLIIDPSIKYINPKWHKYCPDTFFTKILQYMPLGILVILVAFDCIINNFNIHLVFYFLPFYFIFHLWESITSFIEHTNSLLNLTLYEIYYVEEIKYIGVTPEEKEFLLLYINRNCKCISFDVFDNDIFVQADKRDRVALFGMVFKQNRRFLSDQDPNIFKNDFTGVSWIFDQEELKKKQKIYYSNNHSI